MQRAMTETDCIERFQTALISLRAQIEGYIVLPNDPAYDDARRIFNPRIQCYPRLILYCISENDVRLGLQFAQEQNLQIHLRSGGHSVEGFSVGAGMILDLRALDSVEVDEIELTATVGCGCSFHQLNEALEHYRLHVPGGECEDVCVAGFVQGGGFGFTSRMFGMNCDNVIEMCVMLADGRAINASESENGDLWWALRGGGGGSLGVLLSVRYRLWPLERVFAWAVAWPLEKASQRTQALSALELVESKYLVPDAFPELSLQIMFSFRQSLSGIAHAVPCLMVRGLSLCSSEESTRMIAPLMDAPGAIVEFAGMDSYRSANRDLLYRPESIPNLSGREGVPKSRMKSGYADRWPTRPEWSRIFDCFTKGPNPMSYIFLEIYGGAIADFPLEDSAFMLRSSKLNACLNVFWRDEHEKAEVDRYVEQWSAILADCWNGGIYQNYPDVGDEDYASHYWGRALPALAAIKRKYDPDNVFRFAQSIPVRCDMEGARLWPEQLQVSLTQPIQFPQSDKSIKAMTEPSIRAS